MITTDQSTTEVLKKTSEQENEHSNFFQVDVLKAIMIFLVIFDHTIPWDIKENLGVALWERISIPVFLVIMGFNIGRSFQKRKIGYGESYFTRAYFWKKMYRFIFPFIVLYIVSTIIGIIIYGPDIDLVMVGQWLNPDPPYMRYDERHLLIGILPFWGPGNWFLPVIFGSILILPWVYKGFSGSTVRAISTLIICFIVEFAAQYIIFRVFKPIITLEDLYNTTLVTYSIFLLFSAVGLGMWFSRDYNLFSVKNIFMWILFPISLLYLIFYQFFDYHIIIDGVYFLTGDYNFMVFPYSAFLFLVALKLLPKQSKTKLARVIKIISKSTYHILLTQILYFAIVYALYGDHYRASIIGINPTEDTIAFVYLIINWGICIPAGVFWWYTEFQLKKIIRKNWVIERKQG